MLLKVSFGKFDSTNQVLPDLGSEGSLVRNFCRRLSYVISQGNQSWVAKFGLFRIDQFRYIKIGGFGAGGGGPRKTKRTPLLIPELQGVFFRFILSSLGAKCEFSCIQSGLLSPSIFSSYLPDKTKKI